MKKRLVILILFFFVAVKLFSQNYNYNIKDSVINDVRITTKDWIELKSDTIIINGNNLCLTQNAKKINFSFSDIHSIEQNKGNQSLLYGLAGLAAGISVFYLIYQSNNWGDPFNTVSSKKISTTFFICSGVGLGIGILIGKPQKKYKKIFYNGNFIN